MLGALAGCAGYAPAPAWKIDPAEFAALKPDVSTTADVRERIGLPVTAMAYPRLKNEVWDYRYFCGATWMVAHVYFDANGRYRYSVLERDRDYYTGGPGGR